MLHSQRSAPTSATRSGATSSAGQQVGDRDLADPQQPQRHPDEQQPAGRGERGEVRIGQHVAQGEAEQGQAALDRDDVSALAATPQPNEAANAIAANPSRAALRKSWSAPLPRPSLREPRIVSGPVQKISEEATKPSMKRCRSAELGAAGQAALQPAAERLDARLEPQQRAGDAADEQRAQHDQHRCAVADEVGQVVGRAPPWRTSPAISRVTRPRASVTRSRVRTGSRLPRSDAEGGADQDGGDVHDGADTGEHGTPLTAT